MFNYYRIRRCLAPKRSKLSQICKGQDNGDFYFSKFYEFFTKRATGRLFDYYGITPKEENKKIRRSSSQ